MKISKYEDVDPGDWDYVAENSREAWLYHCSQWIKIERKYWFPECRAFMIRSDTDEPIAIFPLYVSEQGVSHGIERLLHSGIHRHTGLATVPSLNRKELKRVQEFAMQEVFRIAEEIGVDRIQLNTQNLAPANLPPSRQEIPFFVEDFHFYFGIKFGPGSIDPAPGQMNCNSDQIVFLDQNESQLFDNIESTAQRAIRKGIKVGVEVVEAGDVLGFQQLMELRQEAARRTQQELMPLQYYADIMALAGQKRQAILLASLNGKFIGGLELLIYKSAVNYFGGFGLNEELNVRYYDVLHWRAILWSRQCGLKYYRLGPHFPDMPVDSPVYKKGRFKKKFGGQPFHILQGSYFRSPEKYVECVSPAAKALPASSGLTAGKELGNLSFFASIRKKMSKLDISRRFRALVADLRK